MSEDNVIREVDDAGNTVSPTRTASTPAQSNWRQNASIPAAIIFGAIIIAGAIYFDGNGSLSKVNIQNGTDTAQNQDPLEAETPESIVAPVTKEDNIRGNPNAPIMIVEYSDYDCPFCKQFHATMNRIIEKYGASGNVAWVYRHFPLEQLHPNSSKIAAASYCVSEQGGDEAFWKFSDLVFGERDVNAQTDLSKLPSFAESSGVDKGKFELCLNSGKYDARVKSDTEAAFKTGARGTPYSVILIGNEKGTLNGAQPYEVVEQTIENLLAQLEGKGTVQ
jgi:protein-disulfide isomerase